MKDNQVPSEAVTPSAGDGAGDVSSLPVASPASSLRDGLQDENAALLTALRELGAAASRLLAVLELEGRSGQIWH